MIKLYEEFVLNEDISNKWVLYKTFLKEKDDDQLKKCQDVCKKLLINLI